jgi:hypothetical protein
MRKLVKRLERLDVVRVLSRLEHDAGVHRARFWVGLTGAWRGRLRHLIAQRIRLAGDAITHATGIYFPNRTHRARIAIKKLRYVTEIAAETGILVDPQLLRDLKKTQDVLGELHDRQTLVDELGARIVHERDADADQIRLVTDVLQAEAEDRHRRFLARRARLAEDCERAQRVVDHAPRSAATLAAASALALTGLEMMRREAATRTRMRLRSPALTPTAAEDAVSVRIPINLADHGRNTR